MDLFKYAQGQTFPTGTLYLVATPIGNLADITIRALHILMQVDGIACEDKRHSSSLLNAYGISKPLYAIHEHNEKSASQHIIEKLAQGERWAYISDAGTPGISDPGATLCNEVRIAGFSVVPLPGPCAVITAISAAGDFLNNSNGSFQFLGFLPTKASQRDSMINFAANSKVASFFYEAPHRIEATLKAIAVNIAPTQRVFVAKEITKIFEEITILPAEEVNRWLGEVKSWQGEYVLGIEASPNKPTELAFDETTLAWIKAIDAGIGHKDLSEIISKVTGIPKKDAYKYLLDLKKS
jgi:16S rRNA (cytidine1402-2'-O)-methyltransferase